MQWITLFHKELLENWHNKKWIWVPLVFILLSLMDPLSYYYLPELIELSGGVPDGTVFDIPKLQAEEVIMMSLEQLSLFGTLIIGFITMGAIAGERKTGTLEMILAKPIKATAFITSKWVSYILLIWLSLIIAISFSAYYITFLYGKLPIASVLAIIGFYGIWQTFIVSIAIFYNSFIRTPGAVLACTIFTIISMSIINMIFGHKLTMFPNQMSTHISSFILEQTISTQLIGTSIITFLLSILLIISAVFMFQKSEVL